MWVCVLWRVWDFLFVSQKRIEWILDLATGGVTQSPAKRVSHWRFLSRFAYNGGGTCGPQVKRSHFSLSVFSLLRGERLPRATTRLMIHRNSLAVFLVFASICSVATVFLRFPVHIAVSVWIFDRFFLCLLVGLMALLLPSYWSRDHVSANRWPLQSEGGGGRVGGHALLTIG